MSISDWKKRWLYDSKVEIPKTTKWRRRCENINNSISDNIRLGDAWEDLSSDTIELGKNTSPFKRQNLATNTSSSIIKRCERKNSYGNFCMQTENAEELELCLQYCQVVFIHALFSLPVCAALCHMIIITKLFHSFKIDWNWNL